MSVLALTGGALDRVAERRVDPAWLSARITDPTTRVLAVDGDRVPVAGDPPELAYAAAEVMVPASVTQSELVLLGVRDDGVAVFAAPVGGRRGDGADRGGETRNGTPGEAGGGAAMVPLRDVATLLPPAEAGIAAHAVAVLRWHSRTRFCSVCGAPSESADGGHARRCTNPEDGTVHHPRTDPCVIVLVTDGDRVLLGRRAGFPAGRYSILAGFVEPGETLEAAVVREVREEAGVAVDEATVRYIASQPWPFPASLMLGFEATARTTDAYPADGELEDVRWVARAALRSAVGEGTIVLPPPLSIANALLARWLEAP